MIIKLLTHSARSHPAILPLLVLHYKIHISMSVCLSSNSSSVNPLGPCVSPNNPPPPPLNVPSSYHPHPHPFQTFPPSAVNLKSLKIINTYINLPEWSSLHQYFLSISCSVLIKFLSSNDVSFFPNNNIVIYNTHSPIWLNAMKILTVKLFIGNLLISNFLKSSFYITKL